VPGVGAPLCEFSQIPPDFVVKSQAIDVAEVILALIRQPNVVSTLWRNRQSRRERLSTSETHGSTTKSDGMWEFPSLSGPYQTEPVPILIHTTIRFYCKILHMGIIEDPLYNPAAARFHKYRKARQTGIYPTNIIFVLYCPIAM
jgi:hypothetical protein